MRRHEDAQCARAGVGPGRWRFSPYFLRCFSVSCDKIRAQIETYGHWHPSSGFDLLIRNDSGGLGRLRVRIKVDLLDDERVRGIYAVFQGLRITRAPSLWQRASRWPGKHWVQVTSGGKGQECGLLTWSPPDLLSSKPFSPDIVLCIWPHSDLLISRKSSTFLLLYVQALFYFTFPQLLLPPQILSVHHFFLVLFFIIFLHCFILPQSR